MTGLDAAEDPRGRSAQIWPETYISQHQFKSRRRFAAIERRSAELARIKIQNVELQLQVAYLQQQLVMRESWVNPGENYIKEFVAMPKYIPSRLPCDDSREVYTKQNDTPVKLETVQVDPLLDRVQCIEAATQVNILELDTGDDAQAILARGTSLLSLPEAERLWAYRHSQLVQEFEELLRNQEAKYQASLQEMQGRMEKHKDAEIAAPAAKRSYLSPVLGALLLQHRWRQKNKASKFEVSCKIVGGPPALDTAMVYTKEEMSKICDALVEPLAHEVHILSNPDFLLGDLAPKASTDSLGGLLRDICAKVVPLTAIVQERRDMVQRLWHENAQRKRCKPSTSSCAPSYM